MGAGFGTSLDADTLESRAALACGFDPLDVLQAQRAAKVRQAAPLRALRDNLDARRRAQRGFVLALLNRERAERGEKELAASLADTVASGDPRFIAWCDEVEMKLATLAILEDEIAAITEQVNRGQALLRWASAERYST